MKTMVVILLLLTIGLTTGRLTGPKGFGDETENIRPETIDQVTRQSRVTIVSSLPIECSFASGSRIVFKMPSCGLCQVNFKNLNSQAAKISLSTLVKEAGEGGKNNDPVLLKTKTLTRGEFFRVSLPGKAGDKVVLEVHEGKVRVEVYKDPSGLADNLKK